MATLDQAIAQMRGAGMPDFPPGHPRLNTERIVRYGPKSKAWYRLYEYPSRNGNRYVVGAYGMWGEIDASKIETDWTGIDELERDRIRESQAQLEALERAKRAQRALYASRRGEQQWKDGSKTKPEGVETYLDGKGVQHEVGIRYARADGTVLVPMVRYDIPLDKQDEENYTGPRRFVGLQKIAPDGTKRFNKGIGMEGAACRLGAAPKAGELVLITEGLATGLTLRMGTGGKYAVFVAFNAGNLPRVAEILRKQHPKSAFLFCADDDAYLVSSLNKLLRENYGAAELVRPPCCDRVLNTKHGPGLVSAEYVADADGVQGIVGALRYNERTHMLSRQNAGRTYAHRSAAAVGNATVVYPRFRDRPLILPAEPDLVDKLTDFNDLHKAEGIEAVRTQLGAEISRYELSAQVQKMVDERLQETKKRKTKEGGEKDKPPPRPIDWSRLFSRYTLIYPTDTLWDAEYRQIVKLSTVKIDSGDAAVNAWLRSPGRRTVNADQVVFDPSETCGEGCINLFTGMPGTPSTEASCDRLLAMVRYLCGEEEAGQYAPISDWVLRWMAYPLQHPGAKMQTAIVMHGAEGTGKNLLWNAVRSIYGEYGVLITQTELEDKYNGWLSRKLFLIANEVISRQELRHHVGRLKNMITESPLPIRDMYMPLRYEANHANAVFLTNENRALQISPGDRRYTIIRTPEPKDENYYTAVAAELKAGGAAALHKYLLELDCGDFNENTKPPATLAKDELIELGMSSAQRFQTELHDGLIWPLQYITCLSNDLYKAYLIWCGRSGERNPLNQPSFSSDFAHMNGVKRKVVDIEDPEQPHLQALKEAQTKRRRQGTVFFMGEETDHLTPEGIKHYRTNCIRQFRQDLKDYAKQHDDLRRGGADEGGGERAHG